MTSKHKKWLINLKKVYMTLVFYFGLFLDEFEKKTNYVVVLFHLEKAVKNDVELKF